MKVLHFGTLISAAVGLVMASTSAMAASSHRVGSLSVPRLSAAAVLLDNGRVLITGGQGPWSWATSSLAVQATAELFDPTTNSFSSTGSMRTGRVGHTATLLKDGRVLVVGGWNDTLRAVSSAELYDPQTGLFIVTGDLNQPRSLHTASLLPDGTVLIVGGQGRLLRTAEIYDPATGLFHIAGLTTIPREGHVAVTLRDGRVLIAGGDVNEPQAPDISSVSTDRVEVYDPATGAFAPAGTMLRARWSPVTALLRDGRVLIAGGEGNDLSGTEFTTEILDPNSGSSQAGPTMSPQMVREGTATLLADGTVVVAGGFLDDLGELGATPVLRIFDPASNTFRQDLMIEARTEQTATVLHDGRLLLAGGSAGNAASVSGDAELYGDPTARPRHRAVGRR